jgi:hypothetical protein
MNMENIYLIKHNSKVFKPHTLVKYITCTYSGNCYLIEKLGTDEREWLMYYDLYPVECKKINNYMFYYNEDFQRIADNLISKLVN